MKIIPAIDIIDGKCVRLSKGDYNTKKVYSENPLEMAKSFENYGIKHLHLVDLDGAKAKKVVNYKVLETIATETDLTIDFGGGLRSDDDVKIAFESGASLITGGSIAIKQPELFIQWVEKYGTDRIILGADCKHRKIAVNGWLEESEVTIIEYLKYYEKHKLYQMICTDISRDGMLNGPAIGLYKEILEKTSFSVIASGGVSALNDLYELEALGCSGVIIGKAIYERRITLKQLSELC